jgi:hypothetical protein
MERSLRPGAYVRAPLLAASLFIPGIALSADNGFYLGAASSEVSSDYDETVGSLSAGPADNDNGFKVMAGFRPLDGFAIEANYADLEAHKLEHLKLIGQLDDLCLRHLTEDKPIYFEMLRFLKTWLREHIKGVDTKYSTALKQAGFSFATWEREAAEEFNVMIEKTGRWWKIW